MSGVVIDTNVLSELARRKPEPQVARFLSEQTDLWLSVVTVHELRLGLELLPAHSERRIALEAKVDALLEHFAARVLPIGPEEAAVAATLRATAQRAGRTLHLADALVAATAITHHQSLATRNTRDFEGLGIAVVNPWADASIRESR